MKTPNCRICDQRTRFLFFHCLLNKYNVSYYICENCWLLQSEKPFWLKEAYAEAIAKTDTGIIFRNIEMSKILTVLIPYLVKDYQSKKYLDYGAGYGLLVRLMRDIGLNFYWQDKFCENLFAKGFETKGNTYYELVTAFELFEHLENPIEEIRNITSKFNPSHIIFSTQLYGENPPNPDYWWYYSFESGQHISFFNTKTLKHLADLFGFNLLSNGINFHIFTKTIRSKSIFRMLIKFKSYLFPIIKKQLKSKTFSDHNYIKKLHQ